MGTVPPHDGDPSSRPNKLPRWRVEVESRRWYVCRAGFRRARMCDPTACCPTSGCLFPQPHPFRVMFANTGAATFKPGEAFVCESGQPSSGVCWRTLLWLLLPPLFTLSCVVAPHFSLCFPRRACHPHDHACCFCWCCCWSYWWCPLRVCLAPCALRLAPCASCLVPCASVFFLVSQRSQAGASIPSPSRPRRRSSFSAQAPSPRVKRSQRVVSAASASHMRRQFRTSPSPAPSPGVARAQSARRSRHMARPHTAQTPYTGARQHPAPHVFASPSASASPSMAVGVSPSRSGPGLAMPTPDAWVTDAYATPRASTPLREAVSGHLVPDTTEASAEGTAAAAGGQLARARTKVEVASPSPGNLMGTFVAPSPSPQATGSLLVHVAPTTVGSFGSHRIASPASAAAASSHRCVAAVCGLFCVHGAALVVWVLRFASPRLTGLWA